MRIRNIRQTIEGDYIKVAADCSIRSFGDDEVYFRFPKKYQDFVKLDASPFVATLLAPAMKLGEDLFVEGAVDKKMLAGIPKIMQVMLSWPQLKLHKINIRVDGTTVDKQKPPYIASFFSGGVDSFYTYLKNKNTVGRKPTHLILVNGFDIELRNKKLWQKTFERVKKVAAAEHIEVIDIECNIYRLITPIIFWEHSFGGCLAAMPLLMRNGFQKAYIPSSYRVDQQFASSSHSAIDKHWSTETLSIFHDGDDVTRFEKTQYIAHSKLALENLRVCNENGNGKYNCGHCDKCLRTMISLEIAGTLKKAKTFPPKLDLNSIRNAPIQHEFSAIFQRENLAALKKSGKHPRLKKAVEESLGYLAEHPKSIPPPTMLSRLIFADHMYNRGRIYKTVSAFRHLREQ